MLTTGANNFVGTAGNDTFDAGLVDQATPANSTLTAADVLKGGAGTDTLNITGVGTTLDALGGAQVSEIEIINVRATTANTLNAANAAGATTVNANLGTGTFAVTNLATGAAIGVIGNGTVVNGAVSFAYATASSDVTLNLAGGTKAGTTVTNSDAASAVTKATINSTGAANAIGALELDGDTAANQITSLVVNAATDLTATLTADDYAATAALTVSGAAASVDLGTAANFKTIDASGLTAGGLTVALGTNTTSFKGGQGNDVVTTAVVAATTAGAVDAGAGTADILNVGTGTDVDSAAKAAVYTNFEVLRNSGATNLDVSLLSGITSVQLNSADAGATKLTAAQAANIKVLATNTTNTIGLTTATGTADVLGLTLENLTAAAVATPIDVTGLTATGFETLNVVSSSGVKAGGTGTGNDLAFAAAGDLTAINVSGAYDLTIAAASITKAVNITSTQSGTAALYVSGDFANGSSVTGSGGADAFILGAGFGTYNGGAGNDSISATAAQLNTGANYNVVNGGEGTDTLTITGGATLAIVDNNLSKISGIEKIIVNTTGANNQSIQTGGWFDAAFKATGVDLTTTASTGNVTIDMTSFTGAAKISATTVGTVGGQGAISIQTGSGADDITVSAAAAGDAGAVKTFAGNDKITTAGDEAFTITAGAGNDTIVLNGTGVHTLVFEDTAALNGVDTITSFNKAADIINWVKGDSEVAVTGSLTTTANAFYQLGGLAAGKADTAADVAAAMTAGATWTAAAVTAWIAVSDDNSTAIYQWTDVAGTAGVQVGEITLVGTIDAAMSSAELATAITIA